MRHTLQIIDEFLPAGVADALRQECIALPFQDTTYKGETYPNIGHLPPEWALIIATLLEQAVGSRIRLHLQFVRYSKKEEKTPQWIHADNGEAQYAAVFYLSDPQTTIDGTSFWKHLGYGSDEIRPEASASLVDTLDADGQDCEEWTRCGHASQVFNRLIVYPTRLFHSRFPRESAGHDAATGRMIWVAFFDKIR